MPDTSCLATVSLPSGTKTTSIEEIRIILALMHSSAGAMTLLVLYLKLPEDLKMSSDSEVWRQFLELTGRFSTYTLSFIVLGTFWIGNHLLFHFVRKVNRDPALVKSAFLDVHHPVAVLNKFTLRTLPSSDSNCCLWNQLLLISLTSLCN